jgi:hypothetical protein
MRANEFITETSGGTTSGSIATVSLPVGAQVLSRQLTVPKTKYANTYKGASPVRKIKNARG